MLPLTWWRRASGGRGGPRAGGQVRVLGAAGAPLAERAARAGRAEVPQDTVVFTVKLPSGWPGGARARPSGRAQHLRGRHPGAGGIPRQGSREPSPQVNGRRSRRSSSSTGTRPPICQVAYAILVPQRRARAARPGQEGGLHDERGDLCPGVQRPAEEGPDDRVADRALRAHAATSRLEVPDGWVFEDEGIPARRWSARRWRRCGTWPPRAASTWCCATRRTGWPASSPTRRC